MEAVDPTFLEAYLANRLIPLDKNPGIRPTGMGEILQCIIGKAIAWDFKPDFQVAAGPIEVCAGH